MVRRDFYTKTPEEYKTEHFEDDLNRQVKVSFKDKFLKNRKIQIILGAVVVAVVLLVVFLVLNNRVAYTGEHVFLEIEGSDSVASGSEITYTINAINKEEVDLKNVEVELILPSDFTLISSSLPRTDESTSIWQLGEVPANYKSDFTITGKISGVAGDVKLIKGFMRFQPQGLGADFSVEMEKSTVIATGDVTLSIDAPQATASGNNIEYEVRYKNTGQEVVDDLYVRMTYPQDFTFGQADPEPTENNNIWKLGAIRSGGEGVIKISGSLVGSSGEPKKVVAELGTMTGSKFYTKVRKEDSTSIEDSAVAIDQTFNGQKEIVADTGSNVEVVVSYQNMGSVGLHNAELEVSFDNTDLIEITSLQPQGGIYQDGKITWDGVGLPELSLVQPSQKGSVSFTFNIKPRESLPVSSASDKNLAIISQATLRSDDIPVSVSASHSVESDEVIAKISSYMQVEAFGYYYDQSNGVPVGSGPIPPKVGEKTTYRVVWEVSNLTNDVNNAQVSVSLAPGVTWEGNDRVSHGQDLSYNTNTSMVTWDIGRIPANTGTFSQSMTAQFDISINPGANKVGSAVELVRESNFSGVDVFTNVNLRGTSPAFTTELTGDKYLPQTGGLVVP